MEYQRTLSGRVESGKVVRSSHCGDLQRAVKLHLFIYLLFSIVLYVVVFLMNRLVYGRDVLALGCPTLLAIVFFLLQCIFSVLMSH